MTSGLQTGHLTGTCLVVEDEAVISLMLEDELRAAGAVATSCFNTCSGALDWLAHNTPQAAVIDLIVADGSCLDLVRRLRAMQVPFVIYSGRARKDGLAQEAQDAPWLEKPATACDVVAALKALIRRA